MPLLGRYELFEVLGQGGFAVVHRAFDPVLEREIAIKVLHPHLSGDPQIAERFVREGRSLARIKHPNLVQVYDAGTADGRAFIAMELITGRSLASVMAERRLSLPEVSAVIGQAAGAIDAVHAAGLVHRDIKPANIILEPSGRAVLLDLGVARDLESSGITATGLLVGTPGFLAPEQVDSSIFVGPRTDVYQLGATAYTLLAGKPPYEGDTARVLYSVAHMPPPDLGADRPDLPYHVVAAVARALAKDPAQRPDSASAFAAELAGARIIEAPAPPAPTAGTTVIASALPSPAQSGEGLGVGAQTTITPPTAPTTDTTLAATAPPSPAQSAEGAGVKAPRRSPIPLVAALAAVVLAAGAIGALLLLGGGGGDQTSAADEDPSPEATRPPGDLQPGAGPVTFQLPGVTRISFSGPSSGLVSFHIEDPTVGASYSVVDERGKLIGNPRWVPVDGGFIDPVEVADGTIYYLQVEPEKGKSGATTIAMYAVPEPSPHAITPGGEAVAFSVDVPGATDSAEFEAAKGQRLSIVTSNSPLGYFIRVVSAENAATEARAVWIPPAADGFVDVFRIPSAGRWRIVADPPEATLIRASVRLYDVGEESATPLGFGSQASVATKVPGENAVYSFQGKSGQVISVRASRVRSGSYLVLTRDAAPDRQIQAIWAPPPTGNLLVARLPADDTYFVTVDPAGANTETATVGLYDVTEAVRADAAIGGPPVRLATSAPGQNAIINFEAQAARTVNIRSRGLDGAYITLISGAGDEVVSRRWLPAGGSLALTIPAAGRFQLRLDPEGSSPGSYELQLEASQ